MGVMGACEILLPGMCHQFGSNKLMGEKRRVTLV